jgi:glycosyltransferase involved in cell wall biosynthesis
MKHVTVKCEEPEIWLVGVLRPWKPTAGLYLASELALGFQDLGLVPKLIPMMDDNPVSSKECVDFRGISVLNLALRCRSNIVINRFVCFLNALIISVFIFRRRHRIRAVFCESVSPFNFLFLSVICRLGRIPVTIHVVEEDMRRYASNKEKKLFFRLFNIITSRLVYPIYYSLILRLPNVVCYIAPHMKNYLAKWGIPQKRLHFLPNVIHSSTHIEKTSDCSESSPDDFYVIFTGRMSLAKDAFAELIRAFEILKERSCPVSCRIYGSASKRTISEFSKMLDCSNAKDRFTRFGFVSRDELLKAQQGALLGLLIKSHASSNMFNFPTKMMDYLNTGTTILMSDLPLHKTFFHDKKTALIVDPHNPNEIADSIEWAWNNVEHCKGFSLKAKQLQRNIFDATSRCQDLMNVL